LGAPGAITKTVKAPSWGKPAAAGALVFIAALSFLNARYIYADHLYMRSKIVETGVTAVATIDRAIRFNPFNEMYRLDRGYLWQKVLERELSEVERAGAVQDAAAATERARMAFTYAESGYLETIRYAPYEYDTYVFLASLYNLGAMYLEDPEYTTKAIEIGRKGVEVSRYGPAVRVQLAVAYIDAGRLPEALEHLEVATSLDPNYIAAWLLYGGTLRDAGRADDARAAYEHVLAREPGNAQAAQGITQLDADTTSTAQ